MRDSSRITRQIIPLFFAFAAGQGRAGYEAKTYVYKVVDGCEIRADVFQPAGGGIHPAILWMHGGSLISGTRVDPAQAFRYLDAGIAVVSIDYRLAPETKLPAILEDVRDAYAWLREKAPEMRIDPDRIALVGHSAGGYLALAGGAMLEPKPKAIVTFYGYGDVDGAWCNRPHPPDPGDAPVSRETFDKSVSPRPISFSVPDDPARDAVKAYIKQQRRWTKEVTGFDPDSPHAVFDPYCPVRNVTARFPATFMMHGDKDPGVPYQQSVAMVDELKRHGVEAHLTIIPGAAHGFERKFLDEPGRVALYARVIAFLNEHLGQTVEGQKRRVEGQAARPMAAR